jgi:hypothetical protein
MMSCRKGGEFMGTAKIVNYDLVLSQQLSIIKFSDQHPEDEDRDGLQNVGFFTIQPLDLADSPRELYYSKLFTILSCYT